MDISKKTHLLNTFFPNQCTIIDNTSTSPDFTFRTNHKLNNIKFHGGETLSIIRALNVNKAHECDNISIRISKICDELIILPLLIIFETALRSGIYPTQWKNANVIPIYKKDSKNLLKNYGPIYLLPICGKIFEKCIFNSIYSYFEDNNLFSPYQSGFRKNDSCVSQLLVITHEIFANFNASLS